MMPGAFALPAPYAYRCPIRHCTPEGGCDCSCLETGFEMVDQQSVGSLCAILAEPVLSAGGIIVPPPDYFRRMRELCDERGMLLILDESQTGFGRLGAMFGFEIFGVVPDFLTVSKTLGGGIPLGAVLTNAETEAVCHEKGFMHVTSHVSDPMPAAAGLAVIDTIEEQDLIGMAKERGERLFRGLGELQERHEQIGEVRGMGLLLGVELVEERGVRAPADELGVAVGEECLRHEMSMNIVRSTGGLANCLRLAPPLSITEEEIDMAVEILDGAISAALDRRSSVPV
jgi:2,2-dialkylglycine decarboxylase (pyruvate)